MFSDKIEFIRKQEEHIFMSLEKSLIPIYDCYMQIANMLLFESYCQWQQSKIMPRHWWQYIFQMGHSFLFIIHNTGWPLAGPMRDDTGHLKWVGDSIGWETDRYTMQRELSYRVFLVDYGGQSEGKRGGNILGDKGKKQKLPLQEKSRQRERAYMGWRGGGMHLPQQKREV